MTNHAGVLDGCKSVNTADLYLENPDSTRIKLTLSARVPAPQTSRL